MKKILFIDDDPEFRENIAEILRLSHYDVDLAETAKEGVEKATRGRPDLILCSTAMRTRQTLAPLLKRLGAPSPPIALESGLYLASEDVLLAHLQTAPDSAATVLLVGHNDGIGQLAADLAGSGPADALASLRAKYPTGALAVFAVPDGPWSDLAPGKAKLIEFVRPRDLAAADD